MKEKQNKENTFSTNSPKSPQVLSISCQVIIIVLTEIFYISGRNVSVKLSSVGLLQSGTQTKVRQLNVTLERKCEEVY